MKTFIIILFLVLLVPTPVFAENWQYPLEKTPERASYKFFGQYFDKSSYKGSENLFPNQYVGYHAGTDLEIFPEELDANVPVFAVGNGTIVYVGNVTGYGGLILEKFDNLDLTALYGHLKLSSINLKIGDHAQTDQTIASLGNAFSNETGGERKHLHFAIYQGHDLYFKGYENIKPQLDQKWIDPMQFLQTKIINITPTIIPSTTPQVTQKNLNFFQTIWNWIKNMVHSKS